MAKLKDKEAVQEIARAIELEPTEPLYRLHASEAYALQKNYAEQMKQLQEYIRMSPNDPDRLAEAKAGLEVLRALGAKDIGVVTAPAKSSANPLSQVAEFDFHKRDDQRKRTVSNLPSIPAHRRSSSAKKWRDSSDSSR